MKDPPRHHHLAGRLREELRPHGDRRLHVQGPPVGQQARDPRAVEEIWGVEVSKVNTLNRKGKKRRTRGTNRSARSPT